MSVHINAKADQIADAVLLPGDPLRAKFIAENFLEEAECYNEVRGMLGFTGTYNGRRVSVQGTGMGQPSISIYANELFSEYGVQTAIRVGTCGSLKEEIRLRDTIIVSAACSESALQTGRFGHLHYAPAANFDLLIRSYNAALLLGVSPHVGLCASHDAFYDESENWRLWAKYGVLGVEMEAAELYTLSAKFGRKALCILTVSDHVVTGEQTSSSDREKTFSDMVRIALETIANE